MLGREGDQEREEREEREERVAQLIRERDNYIEICTERLARAKHAEDRLKAVEAENLKLRSSLMLALKKHIEREELSQTEAAKVFGVTQPRISNLMHGKIELFGLDMLVNMLSAAGLRVSLRVKKAA